MRVSIILCLATLALATGPVVAAADPLHLEWRDGHSHYLGYGALAAAALIVIVAAVRRGRAGGARKPGKQA